jgi:lipopolysaccharide/colanic/teichoic acid biosynthesis glycosyltransferase
MFTEPSTWTEPKYRSACVKPVFDFVLSGLLLVLLLPVWILVGIGVRLDSPGPMLYTQLRMGQNGRPFRIYKFRTMCEDAETQLAGLMHLNMHARAGGDTRLYKLMGDPRVTRVGSFLRRYSIDEFPQLLNVCKGEMSLVGPRPLTPEEDQYVTGNARLRRLAKPGITGPWQVSGRNQLNFDEMMWLDCEYVNDWSFLGDLIYLIRTVPAILRAEQAY